jgi:N utilization substance protein B
MSRRQAREIALQALFQLDLNQAEDGISPEAQETFAVDSAVDASSGLPQKDLSYARDLVHGAKLSQADIDSIIRDLSLDWSLERMAAVDRNIVRIAIYEMQFSQEKLAPKIAINEAVELAKKFGTDESGRYVNGVLGKMVK